ncbi:MAG: regulatory particle non-ATPase [Candelina mexicana]|nr:MAG: regulatory particle non-ATPase [Candelina mexicana]
MAANTHAATEVLQSQAEAKLSALYAWRVTLSLSHPLQSSRLNTSNLGVGVPKEMSSEGGQTVLDQSVIIRQELKGWEKEFAAANDGRKAGREDIKKNPTIASRYKEYERLRALLSGKAPPSQPHQSTKKRTESRKEAHHSPIRRSQHKHTLSGHDPHLIGTPSKPTHPASLDPYDTPTSARKSSTPSHRRTFIGPTPQKDGLVLGLFDLLSEQTPSKNERRATLGGVSPNAQMDTPSKSLAAKEVDVEVSGGGRRSRTPASTGKRFLLDCFATPMKRRRLDGDGRATPSSASKLHFSTPAFLRRDSQRLNAVDEEGNSPPEMRLPKQPPIRGLSSMLAGLRKMEDEKLDEEIDLLREMEMGGVDSSAKIPQVLVGDSQAVVVPGMDGFESVGSRSEDEDEKKEGLGRDGKPLKVWKKKGQKRTTRRVIMRPVRSKPKARPEAPPCSDTDDELAVPETQPNAIETTAATRLFEHEDDTSKPGADATENGSDTGTESDYSNASLQPKKHNPVTASEAKELAKAAGPSKDDGPVKKVAKKISAQAHANFRKLNIKNKNTKGRGFGRRGGRRR